MRSHFGNWASAAIVLSLCVACSGPTGPAGSQGPAGDPGTDGTDGVAGPTGAAGTNGATGANGANGTNGTAGANATSCWDLNSNFSCDMATEDKNGDATCDALDCQGLPGFGYLSLEANGVVGVVKDTAGAPVVNATVYFMPQADIPDGGLELGASMAAVRADPNDEPLEDTIAARGAGYTKSVTNADGVYRVATVPQGKFFMVAVPASTDTEHLPGGSLCRTATARSALVGRQINIEVSTTPSSSATYVGPSVCLTCHGRVHQLATAHMNGLRKIGKTGPLQDSSRFPDWDSALTTRFTASGTTIYFYAYGGTPGSPNYKVSETDPGSGVSFSARMYSTTGINGPQYWVDLVNVKNGAQPAATYEVDMSYGGGVYKQRYLAKLPDGSRYVLPIQFNFDGQTIEATTPFSRWVWQHYNAQYWYDEAATPTVLKVPAKSKAFDNNCAGCHFSGFSLTGDATAGFRAHGVPDKNGEMDFDGDGKLEAINTSCENCHGPGSEHWARAGSGRAIVSPDLLTPEREVAICSACHTRALGIGGGATEAPLDTAGHMPRAGISRATFLTNHVSKIDDALWATTNGDGKQSVKHHQQASDFIKSRKYRNTEQLVTCASCHDAHGDSGDVKQLWTPQESANGTEGLCLKCHGATFSTGTTLAARFQAHYAAKGLTNIAMGDAKCASCHMPKTMKSGSGLAQATIAGVTYYSGDAASHLFKVPMRTSIPGAGKGPEMMPIPYTNKCGEACHTTAP